MQHEQHSLLSRGEGGFFIDCLLVRIHLIIEECQMQHKQHRLLSGGGRGVLNSVYRKICPRQKATAA